MNNIFHLFNSEINRQKWDQCCESAGSRFWFAKSWYLDIVSPGWEALVLADYEAVMPLPVKNKFGIKYIVQPFMMPQGGIVSNNTNKELTNLFIIESQKKFKYININLNFSNKFDQCKLLKNHYFGLNEDFVQIKSKYAKRTKENIRIAKRNNYKISENYGMLYFLKMYYKFAKWISKSQSVLHTEIINKINDLGKCRFLFAVNDKDEVSAGVFFFTDSNEVIIRDAISTNAGKYASATALIYDNIIEQYSGSNYEIDFTGSSMSGIAMFLEGFGAKYETYQHIKINNLTWPLNRLI